MLATEIVSRSNYSQEQEFRVRAEVAVYINGLRALARASGVEAPEMSDDPVTLNNMVDKVIEAEHFLDRLYAENISELDNQSGLGAIQLDDTWRAKVSSSIFHIREVVKKAQMQESIRERIYKALSQLQLEVDKNRTRPQAWAEVWLPITEAIGKGAKNLEPALRLLERGAGAVSRLRTGISGGHMPPRLPPPETMGLNDDVPNF